MTVPAYRSSTHASGSGTQINLDKPSGTVDNDILLLIVYWENDSAVTVTPPSGFVSKGSGYDITATSPDSHHRYYWKRASGEGSSYTTTLSISSSYNSTIVSISGCVTSGDPIEAYDGTTANGDLVLPSITTLTSDTLLCAWASAFEFMDSWSSSDMSERTELDCQAFYTEDRPTAGSTGTQTITQNAQSYAAGQIFNLASTTGEGPTYKYPMTLLGVGR